MKLRSQGLPRMSQCTRPQGSPGPAAADSAHGAGSDLLRVCAVSQMQVSLLLVGENLSFLTPQRKQSGSE